MIRVQGVTKKYRRGGETLVVLDGLDLEMQEGGFYALMGPSGSGKTTLLNLVGGLDRPDAGELYVAEENLADLSGSDLAEWRSANVGFVFQGFNLIPVLTALENVELPLSLTPPQRARNAASTHSHALRARRAWRTAPGTGRGSSPAARSSASPSRVRSATDPKVILADEPTGDLDRESAEQVLELLRAAEPGAPRRPS